MNLGQSIGLLAIVAAAYILWEIRQVLLLVFAAVVLAIALNKLAQRLQRFGLKRGQSVLLAVVTVLLVIIGIFWLIVPAFAHQFQELTYLIPKAVRNANYQLDQARTRAPEWILPYVPDLDSLIAQLQPLLNQLLTRSFSLFSSSLGIVLNFLLVLVLTIMFLANPLAYRNGFIRLFPSFYRRRMDEVLQQSETSLGRWAIGALTSMSVIGLLSWIGLSLLGVRAALANAIVAGLLNLIPNIGPTFSVIPPMAIGLLDAGWKPVAVFVLYFLIQQFESNLLTPYIMSQQVALLPAVTLMSQVFFASFFGFLGLFLALPLTVVGQVWVREVLIKDVLDHWRSRNEDADRDLTVLVSTTEPAAPSSSTSGLSVSSLSPVQQITDPASDSPDITPPEAS